MDLDSVVLEIQEKINNARISADTPILLAIDTPEEIQYVNCSEIVFETEVESSEKSAVDMIKAELDNLFEGTNLNPEQQDKKQSMLDRFYTHGDFRFTVTEEKVVLLLMLFGQHLQLDKVGPFIDGDLVIQGSALSTQYGPAFCVVESATEPGLPFSEVLVIAPWRMILSPPEGDSLVGKFMIPISIGTDYEGCIVRVRIFVDEASRVPYEEESTAYDMGQGARVANRCAISFESYISREGEASAELNDHPATDEAELDEELAFLRNRGSEENDLARSEDFGLDGFETEQSLLVVRDIKIAFDYDDVISLQAEGFELLCSQITPEGINNDQEHLWKFHVLAAYGEPDGVGVEDLAFIKCLKSLGTLPALPFFEIMHDYDLSEPDDDYSIYIAVKMGPNPRFKKLIMVSSLIEHEEFFSKYVSGVSGALRPAPTEISKAFGGPCGLLLITDMSKSVPPTGRAEQPALSIGTPTQQVVKSSSGGRENVDDLSRMTPTSADRSGEESEEEDDDDDYEDEEDVVANLLQQISELDSEKHSLLSLNTELQKKAVTLMLREKSMQGQSAAARGATTEGAAAVVEQPVEVNAEHNQEKDKQYHDTLHLIVEDRVKLNEQLKEFDQLALDLQTRLDDKELKFNGIDLSFKKFKKEILVKAENSRTGHNISKKQIKQFETSEQKREEDLEKVRLRNISLRTTFRKLERTLRAREQLAEGLHMIDFEQLKIENQTLNEKIEERNEELAKLKRKKTTTVQVLTHVREKLRFIEQANKVVQYELSGLESSTTALRSTVTSDKLQRDAVRMENAELKAKQGFASSDLLLVDYEKRRSKVEQLRASIAELKDRYGILMRQVNLANSRSNSTPWNLMSGSKL